MISDTTKIRFIADQPVPGTAVRNLSRAENQPGRLVIPFDTEVTETSSALWRLWDPANASSAVHVRSARLWGGFAGSHGPLEPVIERMNGGGQKLSITARLTHEQADTVTSLVGREVVLVAKKSADNAGRRLESLTGILSVEPLKSSYVNLAGSVHDYITQLTVTRR